MTKINLTQEEQKSTRFLGSKAVSILLKWFHGNKDYPYPDEETTMVLAKEASISCKQVKKWFANKRVRSQLCFKQSNRSRKRSNTISEKCFPNDIKNFDMYKNLGKSTLSATVPNLYNSGRVLSAPLSLAASSTNAAVIRQLLLTNPSLVLNMINVPSNGPQQHQQQQNSLNNLARYTVNNINQLHWQNIHHRFNNNQTMAHEHQYLWKSQSTTCIDKIAKMDHYIDDGSSSETSEEYNDDYDMNANYGCTSISISSASSNSSGYMSNEQFNKLDCSTSSASTSVITNVDMVKKKKINYASISSLID